MPASEITSMIPSVLSVLNQDKSGRNLVLETHEITFTTDKTVEVDIDMAEPKAMFFCEKNGAVGATAFHLGTDLVLTTGKVTVSTNANNTLVWIVTFIGYK